MDPASRFKQAVTANRVALRFAKIFPDSEALNEYLREHPHAQREIHHVRKDSEKDDDTLEKEHEEKQKSLGGRIKGLFGLGKSDKDKTPEDKRVEERTKNRVLEKVDDKRLEQAVKDNFKKRGLPIPEDEDEWAKVKKEFRSLDSDDQVAILSDTTHPADSEWVRKNYPDDFKRSINKGGPPLKWVEDAKNVPDDYKDWFKKWEKDKPEQVAESKKKLKEEGEKNDRSMYDSLKRLKKERGSKGKFSPYEQEMFDGLDERFGDKK
jgi:gas vesicle protein